MKRTYILLTIILLHTISVFSQKIKITDENNIAISDVYIYNKYHSAITNNTGEADISAFKGNDTMYFQHPAYSSKFTSWQKLKSNNFKLTLERNILNINEIVVSASKFEEKQEDIPREIEVITEKDIAKDNPQNTADMLAKSGDLFVQKSQMGGGSPIIRGFETNKILLMIDGVRLNNAIYRGGHLQNIITVDESMLKRTEILYGPGSVVYGSDALGGVIHMFTKDPILSPDSNIYTKTNAYLRYATANKEKTAHIDFNLGFKKIASLTSVSIHSFDDLRQGANRYKDYPDWGKCYYYADRINNKDTMIANDDVNIQKRSGYTQYDFMQKFVYRQDKNKKHLLNLQYSTSSNIPRYDRLSQYKSNKLKYADWYYGPQSRLLTAYSFENKNTTKFYDSYKFILAYQNIEESRHNRKFGKNTMKHRTENLNILSANLDFEKQIKEQELRYGVEIQYNNVKSTAYAEDITNGNISKLNTRYPDGGSVMTSFAAYISHSWEINDNFILSDGLRYSYIYLNSKFNDKSFYNFNFDEISQKNSALNGYIGFVTKLPEKWNISVNASSGFRSPNVDDLSKIFDSQPGLVIVPNENIKPEYTYTAELNIDKKFDHIISIKANAFYTWYVDAITTTPYTFNGNDSILYDGEMSKVVANTNAKNAYIYGASAKLIAKISKYAEVQSLLFYTYGRIKTDSVPYPLDHIPPMYGRTSLNFNFGNFYASFYSIYNAWKHKKDYNLFGEDNFSKATPDGTPAWYTLNISASYKIRNTFTLQMQAENLLDQNYRPFASGISAPGRSFIVTLRAEF